MKSPETFNDTVIIFICGFKAHVFLFANQETRPGNDSSLSAVYWQFVSDASSLVGIANTSSAYRPLRQLLIIQVKSVPNSASILSIKIVLIFHSGG